VTTLVPFFLVQEQGYLKIFEVGFNGMLGLAPSADPNYQSYGQYLINRGLIESNTVQFRFNASAKDMLSFGSHSPDNSLILDLKNFTLTTPSQIDFVDPLYGLSLVSAVVGSHQMQLSLITFEPALNHTLIVTADEATNS
jgi:hypothetical protein